MDAPAKRDPYDPEEIGDFTFPEIKYSKEETEDQSKDSGFFSDDPRSIEELAQSAQEGESVAEMRQRLWEVVNNINRTPFTPEALAEGAAAEAAFEQEEAEALVRIDRIAAEVYAETPDDIKEDTANDDVNDVNDNSEEFSYPELEVLDEDPTLHFEGINLVDPKIDQGYSPGSTDQQDDQGDSPVSTIRGVERLSLEQDLVDSRERGLPDDSEHMFGPRIEFETESKVEPEIECETESEFESSGSEMLG